MNEENPHRIKKYGKKAIPAIKNLAIYKKVNQIAYQIEQEPASGLQRRPKCLKALAAISHINIECMKDEQIGNINLRPVFALYLINQET